MTSARLRARPGVLAAVLWLCGACTTAPPPTASPPPTGAPSASAAAAASPTATSGPAPWAPDPGLLAAAQGEGALTTIGLPPDWCNYRALLDTFSATTGIDVTNRSPTASSQDEVDALAAASASPSSGGNSGSSSSPDAPDVIDVSARFGPLAAARGLLAPYKVARWSEIPDSAKDPGGLWYGDYYGLLAFEVDTATVTTLPRDWPDLLAARAGSVALSGDPTRSNQGVFAVWSAGVATAAAGADPPQAGLTYFRSLADAGVLQSTIGTGATVASGQTPIRLAWTYEALADADRLAGQPAVTVVIPTHGRLGGMDVQAISAHAPHPNAARLWMEWLYSDEGQGLWLRGYCTPIRYDAMAKAGALPADVAAHLPDMTGATLPSLDQVTAATTAITKGWSQVVRVPIH